jgi:hypothetical protein
MISLYDDDGHANERGLEVARAFYQAIKPIIEANQDVKVSDLRAITFLELSGTLADVSINSRLRRRLGSPIVDTQRTAADLSHGWDDIL